MFVLLLLTASIAHFVRTQHDFGHESTSNVRDNLNEFVEVYGEAIPKKPLKPLQFAFYGAPVENGHKRRSFAASMADYKIPDKAASTRNQRGVNTGNHKKFVKDTPNRYATQEWATNPAFNNFGQSERHEHSQKRKTSAYASIEKMEDENEVDSTVATISGTELMKNEDDTNIDGVGETESHENEETESNGEEYETRDELNEVYLTESEQIQMINSGEEIDQNVEEEETPIFETEDNEQNPSENKTNEVQKREEVQEEMIPSSISQGNESEQLEEDEEEVEPEEVQYEANINEQTNEIEKQHEENNAKEIRCEINDRMIGDIEDYELMPVMDKNNRNIVPVESHEEEADNVEDENAELEYDTNIDGAGETESHENEETKSNGEEYETRDELNEVYLTKSEQTQMTNSGEEIDQNVEEEETPIFETEDNEQNPSENKTNEVQKREEVQEEMIPSNESTNLGDEVENGEHEKIEQWEHGNMDTNNALQPQAIEIQHPEKSRKRNSLHSRRHRLDYDDIGDIKELNNPYNLLPLSCRMSGGFQTGNEIEDSHQEEQLTYTENAMHELDGQGTDAMPIESEQTCPVEDLDKTNRTLSGFRENRIKVHRENASVAESRLPAFFLIAATIVLQLFV